MGFHGVPLHGFNNMACLFGVKLNVTVRPNLLGTLTLCGRDGFGVQLQLIRICCGQKTAIPCADLGAAVGGSQCALLAGPYAKAILQNRYQDGAHEGECLHLGRRSVLCPTVAEQCSMSVSGPRWLCMDLKNCERTPGCCVGFSDSRKKYEC